MLLPCTSTERLSGLSRRPPQAGQRLLDHELLELLAHAVGRRLAVALFDVLQHAVQLDSYDPCQRSLWYW